MKIAFDFDGVCTELTWIETRGVDLHDYLSSPVGILLSQPRPGALQLLSLLGLVGDIVVLSARPHDHHHDIEKWLDQHGVGDLVGAIYCVGDEPEIHNGIWQNIGLLIGNHLTKAGALMYVFPVIHWASRPWTSVAKEAFGILLAGYRAQIKAAGGALLTEIEHATDWGASHVFILHGQGCGRLKVRVCQTKQECDRLLAFLDATGRGDYRHVARLVAVNGTAVMKSFVEGSSIGETTGESRRRHLLGTGVALAGLHDIYFEEANMGAPLCTRTEPASLLVCSADNRNLIVTPRDDVAFIDLGACACGFRWVDLCWADEMLCQNGQERDVLWAGYLSASRLSAPSDADLESARRSYRVWQTEQLLRSFDTHAADLTKRDAISESIWDLWSGVRITGEEANVRAGYGTKLSAPTRNLGGKQRMRSNVRDIEKWNRLANEYSEWIAKNEDVAGHAFADAIRREILSRLPNDRRTKALDLGCGSGALLEDLSQRYEVLIGCDGSWSMVALAKKLHPSAASRTFVADATHILPFSDGAFDLIVSNMVLMCLDDVTGAFREISRTLRPGGEFIFTVTHPCFSFVRRHLASGEYRYSECFASEHQLGPSFASTVSHYHRPLQFYVEELDRNSLSLRTIAEISPEITPELSDVDRLRPYQLTANAILFHARRV